MTSVIRHMKSALPIILILLTGFGAMAQPGPGAASSNAMQRARIRMLPNAIRKKPVSDPSAPSSNVVVRQINTNGTLGAQIVRYQGTTVPQSTKAASAAGKGSKTDPDSKIAMDIHRTVLSEFSSTCYAPGSGLIGWWQGETNAIDSVGGDNGIPNNGASLGGGWVGSAFSFNGDNQSITVPYTNSLATSNFTFELWINPQGQVDTDINQAFIFGQGFGRQLVVNGGSWGVYVAFYVTDQWGDFYGVSTDGQIPIGDWTHLACTYDGITLSLYTNGLLAAQSEIDLGVPGDSACDFSIGGAYDICGYTDQFFNGVIDEVSVYDRALLNSEIYAIYSAGQNGKCKTPPPSCVDLPAGAIAWWPAEGSGHEVLTNLDATAQGGASFAPGEVGQAFSLSGSYQAFEIPYSATLGTNVFSVEAWIKPLFEPGMWYQSMIFGQGYGRQLVLHPGDVGVTVAFCIATNDLEFFELDSSGEIPLDEWTHLVGTWDGTNLSLYINGALDQQAAVDGVSLDSGCTFHIGGLDDPTGPCFSVGQFFNGLIDEVTVYGRALSANEVETVYNAGSAGKCLPDPCILIEPTNTCAAPGGSAVFSVTAVGTSPLEYQWFHDGSALAGGTNSTLELSCVSLFDAGQYDVMVFNPVGSVTREQAALTVTQVATPVFNPVGGHYSSAQYVAITCATAGADIYYTTNGAEPTESDFMVLHGAPGIFVDHNVTFTAKAFMTGWTPSESEAESYSIGGTPTNLPPVVTIYPANGTVILASDDVPVLVQASDPDGTVTKVQLLRNGNLVAESSMSSLLYTISKASAGTYTFVAKATDNAGYVTVSSSVTITVTNTGPVVTLAGEHPYFGSSPGTLLASVVGVNPGSLRSLLLNGYEQPLALGNFSLNPAIVSGQNNFTLIATDTLNRSGEASATVYLGQGSPGVWITSPTNNSTYSTTSVNVSGGESDSTVKRITVNGIPATITGSTWQALNIPLATGPNSITALIQDISGSNSSVSITVTGAVGAVDPVQLQVSPATGYSPLGVTFTVSASVPGTIQHVYYDFDGDGVTDQTATDLTPVTHTYSTAGQYFPVATVVTTLGSFSSPGGPMSPAPGQRINVRSAPTILTTLTITDPVDLKIKGDGKLYILTGSGAGIYEYDTTASPPSLVRSITAIGSSPTGFDVDQTGNVYVAISGDNQVAKYNPSGGSFTLDTTFGAGTGKIGKYDKTAGSVGGEFNAPYDVALVPDGSEIEVSDSGNARIEQFSPLDGSYYLYYGQLGSDLGSFNTPQGLTYDKIGYLYISDSGNSRICMARLAEVVGASGSTGGPAGGFSSTLNLDVGTRGIYVADAQNNQVKEFDIIPDGPAAPTPFLPRGVLGSELSLSHPSACAAVESLLTEQLWIADRGNNRVILVQLPNDDDPVSVWNNMVSRVAAGDISGAITNFSTLTADNFRQAFLTVGTTTLAANIGNIGTLTAVSVRSDSAQYYFRQTVQGYPLLFPVEFTKENGVWKILEF